MVAGLQILSSEIVVSQGVKFVTLQQGEIPYIGGTLGLLKVKEACYDPLLAIVHSDFEYTKNICNFWRSQ
jgi:hypothetical protein